MLARVGVECPAVGSDDVAWINERAGLDALRRVVAQELGRLSAEHQQALRLRVIDERPYSEIARALGVSEAAARARVSRGLRRLATALEPYSEQIEETVP